MRILKQPLITKVTGPFATRNYKGGYQFYTDRTGIKSIRPRRRGMGPGGLHPSVIWCQGCWNTLDAHWHKITHPQKTDWGKCVSRTNDHKRSNLDEWRSINLNRMMLDMPGLYSPPDKFHSLKRYLTTSAQRPTIPEGKTIPVWERGLMKDGREFDKDDGDIPPPADPPFPFNPPPAYACYDVFNRHHKPYLGGCWNHIEPDPPEDCWYAWGGYAYYDTMPPSSRDWVYCDTAVPGTKGWCAIMIASPPGWDISEADYWWQVHIHNDSCEAFSKGQLGYLHYAGPDDWYVGTGIVVDGHVYEYSETLIDMAFPCLLVVRANLPNFQAYVCCDGGPPQSHYYYDTRTYTSNWVGFGFESEDDPVAPQIMLYDFRAATIDVPRPYD